MILNLISVIASANCIGINMPLSDYVLNNEQTISENCVIAANAMGFDNLNNDQNVVIDLDGNIFIVQECYDAGFLIYDPVAEECMESVRSSSCPYNFDDSFVDFYLGPLNYYYKNGDYFCHCVFEDNVINQNDALNLQLEFTSQLDVFRYNTSDDAFNEYIENNPDSLGITRLHTNGNKIYINNYEIIRDCAYPKNNDNSCGFVSGSILLNYWNKTVHNGTVLPRFYADDELRREGTFENCLSKKLIQYNNNNPDSTARTVANAINNYCSDYGIHGSASWSLGKIGLDNAILADRPAAIFGWFPDVANGGMCSHAVTCYGFDTRWWGGYYIVNYGWSEEFTEVSLGFGLVGETLFFSLDENYYRGSWTITPRDYNFSSYYCTSALTKTIQVSNFSFNSKIYRCGYIENEFVNLSPRKEGFNTAYIEYSFNNPVNSITLDLSFWSNDERYNSPNRAIALIQYKDLMCDEWITKLDLLNDINLSKNRSKQDTLHLLFQNKTKQFRIYTHFDYISGQNDRNKGRISIGNMTVNSYL